MGTVHIGRLLGAAGFARLVAIKEILAPQAADPSFVSAFVREARLAARVRHPHVVQTLDVVEAGREVFLVFDYVPAVTLSALVRHLKTASTGMPVAVIAAVMAGVCRGLHAAHVATDEQGQPLDIIHRDVSPQNVLVGIDGSPKLIDFGIAKALGDRTTTERGEIKGKLAYMAPEQLNGERVTCRSDVFAAAVVLWELLAGTSLFAKQDSESTVVSVLMGPIPPIPAPAAPTDAAAVRALEMVALTGLSRKPANRYASAAELAEAIEDAQRPATAPEVELWLEEVASDKVAATRRLMQEVESGQRSDDGSTPNLITATSTGPDVSPAPSPMGRATSRLGPVGGQTRALAARVAGLVVLLAVGVAGLAWSRSTPPDARPTSEEPRAELGRAEHLLLEWPVVETEGSASESGSALPAGTPTASTVTERGVRAKRASGGGKEDCNVTFTVDESGAKVFHRECRQR